MNKATGERRWAGGVAVTASFPSGTSDTSASSGSIEGRRPTSRSRPAPSGAMVSAPASPSSARGYHSALHSRCLLPPPPCPSVKEPTSPLMCSSFYACELGGVLEKDGKSSPTDERQQRKWPAPFSLYQGVGKGIFGHRGCM